MLDADEIFEAAVRDVQEGIDRRFADKLIPAIDMLRDRGMSDDELRWRFEIRLPTVFEETESKIGRYGLFDYTIFQLTGRHLNSLQILVNSKHKYMQAI